MLDDNRLDQLTAHHRRRAGDTYVLANARCMAEEMGEAIQQIRRYLGLARSNATVTRSAKRWPGVDLAAHIDARLDVALERDQHR